MADPVKVTPEQADEILEVEHPVVLDVRPEGMYDEGHLPGAINLPWDQIDKERAAKIASETDAPIMVYCQTGMHSAIAGKKLSDMGYTKVYDMEGGLQNHKGPLTKA